MGRVATVPWHQYLGSVSPAIFPLHLFITLILSVVCLSVPLLIHPPEQHLPCNLGRVPVACYAGHMPLSRWR